MKDRGGGTVSVFVILLFLSFFLAGISGYLGRAGELAEKMEEELKLESELDRECVRVLESLAEDSTPGCDNDDNDVWDYIRLREHDGYNITVEDVSSRLSEELAVLPAFSGLAVESMGYTSFQWKNERLSEFAGDGYPLLNSMPLLNIYYLDEEILGRILSYPYDGKVLEEWEDKRDSLLRSRDEGSLTDSLIASILDIEEDEEALGHYLAFLGTVTWFWRIEAEKGGCKNITVAARMPIDNDRDKTLESGPRYRIIENYIIKKETGR